MGLIFLGTRGEWVIRGGTLRVSSLAANVSDSEYLSIQSGVPGVCPFRAETVSIHLGAKAGFKSRLFRASMGSFDINQGGRLKIPQARIKKVGQLILRERSKAFLRTFPYDRALISPDVTLNLDFHMDPRFLDLSKFSGLKLFIGEIVGVRFQVQLAQKSWLSLAPCNAGSINIILGDSCVLTAPELSSGTLRLDLGKNCYVFLPNFHRTAIVRGAEKGSYVRLGHDIL
jgi:hypothetical protein